MSENQANQIIALLTTLNSLITTIDAVLDAHTTLLTDIETNTTP